MDSEEEEEGRAAAPEVVVVDGTDEEGGMEEGEDDQDDEDDDGRGARAREVSGDDARRVVNEALASCEEVSRAIEHALSGSPSLNLP